jgi:beta-glucosidase
VQEANPRTVVVLVANFPVALPWAAKNASTILQITHASQEQGNALADVLLGEADPGGRLNQTWPASIEQLPPMMDYDIRHGRTYMYFRGEPQYPFGFGLSYTTFTYSNLVVAAPKVPRAGAIEARFDVTNTGVRAGDTIAQLYVRHPGSKVDRPAKQLRAFKRLTLAPGQAQTVALVVPARDLAYWDEARHAWQVETGPVELLVGTSSADADLTLKKTITVTP